MSDRLQPIAARVRAFRCFADSGDVPLEDVTVLVAENEYGKTSFLQALAWFTTPEPLPDEDRWSGADADVTLPIVSLTLRLSPKASEVLQGQAFSAPEKIVVTKDSLGDYSVVDPAGTDLASAISTAHEQHYDQRRSSLLNILQGWSLSTPEQRDAADQIAGALKGARVGDGAALHAQDIFMTHMAGSADPAVTQITAAMERLVEVESALGAAHSNAFEVLAPYLPKFIYFDEATDTIPDEAAYSAVSADPASHASAINLARIVGFDFDQVQPDGHLRQLESQRVSRTLSKETSRFWSGQPIVFHLTAEENALVIGIEHGGRNQKPSRRSRGLQWYLGFFIKFMAETNEDLRDAVLLLDEPGLSLHVKQQTKLLELFDRLAKENQIVYSTHLPYMIPRGRFHRLRLLVSDEDHAGAVTVKPKIQAVASNADVLKPVRAALGVGIAESISLGDVTIIVEGPADVYILEAASLVCAAHGRPSLPDGVTVLPAGGAGRKMLPLAAFIAGEQTRGAVVVDDDRAGHSTAAELGRAFEGLVPVIRVREGDAQPSGTEIEDLLGRDYYVDLVRNAYRDIQGVEITTADLEPEAPVCDAVNRLFTERGWGGFQKLRVAREFQARNLLGEEPPDEAVEAFAELFGRLNESLQAQEGSDER